MKKDVYDYRDVTELRADLMRELQAWYQVAYPITSDVPDFKEGLTDGYYATLDVLESCGGDDSEAVLTYVSDLYDQIRDLIDTRNSYSYYVVGRSDIINYIGMIVWRLYGQI